MLKLFPTAALRLATSDLHFEISVPALGSRSFFPSKIPAQDLLVLTFLALPGCHSFMEENAITFHYVHESPSTTCVSDKHKFQREQVHCHSPQLLFSLAFLLSSNTISLSQVQSRLRPSTTSRF